MRIAVLGSGNGGCAIAADMALAGHEVSLFDFKQFSVNIDTIKSQGGLHASGKIEGVAKLSYVGNDIGEAVRNAELIMVVSPAYGIPKFAIAVKPFLKPGQIVCIVPSSCGGAIVFKKSLGVELNDENYIVCETSTLPYACRCYEPGNVYVYHKLKGGLYFAALPPKSSEHAFNRFATLYPYAVRATSLLMTMLQTGNNIIHPSITLLSATRIESPEDFLFYEEGATPAAGTLMEALDNEKLMLSEILGIGLIPDPKVKLLQGYNDEENYENAYRTAPGFKGIKAPTQLDHRYLNEDVGFGLVFISELAKQVGLKTPVIDAVILLASTIMKKDYRKDAKLTPAVLGIDKYSVEELKALFSQ
jgi:opine dehydrogenase